MNTYLQPTVDDLIELWQGLPLIEGRTQLVRATLLTVTADLPAIRKMTRFLGHKANLGCTRCKFRTEREPGTSGASGRMSYFTPSVIEGRNHEEVSRQAEEFWKSFFLTVMF